MFLGEYAYRIDEKGRVPIPPRFRPDFRDGIILTSGPEKCVLAYDPAGWQKLADNLSTSGLPASKMRRLNRSFFGSAFHLNVDSQGRIALPAPLRQYTGIKDDVVIAGANSYLEIWDKQKWELERAESQAQMWQTLESLERR